MVNTETVVGVADARGAVGAVPVVVMALGGTGGEGRGGVGGRGAVCERRAAGEGKSESVP